MSGDEAKEWGDYWKLSKTKIILLSLGIILIAALLFYSDLQEVCEVISKLNKNILFFALLSLFPFLYIRTLRWYFLLPKMEISISILSKIIFIGTLGNVIFPAKLGGVFKAFLLKKTTGHSFGYCFGSVFLDNVIDISCALISSFMIASFFLSDISSDIKKHIHFGIFFFVVIILLIFATIKIIKSPKILLPKKVRIFKYNPEELRKFTLDINNYLKEAINSGSNIFVCYILSCSIFANLALMNFLLIKSFGYSIPLSYLFLGSILPIILGLLSMIPGGFGIQEVSMVGIFTAAGLPLAVSTSVTLLSRAIYTIWVLIFGSYGMFSMGVKISEVSYG